MKFRFDVWDKKDHGAGCPLVEDYPRLGKRLSIMGGDKDVTPLPEIKIRFTYPLENPVELTFTHEGGFTLASFWEAVYLGYTAIYAEEDQTAPVKERDIPRVIMNRPPTQGKYGIWGHDMCDLYLEAFEEVEPGVFALGIGS